MNYKTLLSLLLTINLHGVNEKKPLSVEDMALLHSLQIGQNLARESEKTAPDEFAKQHYKHEAISYGYEIQAILKPEKKDEFIKKWKTLQAKHMTFLSAGVKDEIQNGRDKRPDLADILNREERVINKAVDTMNRVLEMMK